MDKNKTAKKEFGVGIVSTIIGTICLLLARKSEIVANCLCKGTDLCPSQLSVLPMLLLATVGLAGVVVGGCLIGSNHSALFNHNKNKRR